MWSLPTLGVLNKRREKKEQREKLEALAKLLGQDGCCGLCKARVPVKHQHKTGENNG
jgi:hypothetical protein